MWLYSQTLHRRLVIFHSSTGVTDTATVALRWFLRLRRIRLPPKIRNTARNTARIRAVARKRNGRIAVTYAKRNGCNPSGIWHILGYRSWNRTKIKILFFLSQLFNFFVSREFLILILICAGNRIRAGNQPNCGT